MVPSRNPILISAGPNELRLQLPTRRATTRLAGWMAEALKVGDLLVLSGGLGAGKTFFTRALCRAYGVPPEVPVTSPTFALANQLEGRIPIVHADLYRLGSHDEVLLLGLDEEREQALLVAEWALPYADVLGGGALALTLSLQLDSRLAQLAPLDGRGQATFERCANAIRQRISNPS